MTISSKLPPATPLLTERRIAKTSPNIDPHEEWYEITLTSTDALEIHINNLTHPDSCIEIYDKFGTRLEHSSFTPDSPIIHHFFPEKEGLYFIRLTIGPDPNPDHLYQLFVDRYTPLSGTIIGSIRLTAEEGPYLIGPRDLIIPAGSSVTVEAGATLNVRGPNKIVVQDSGALYLCGESTNHITIIGAIGDPTKHQWNQLFKSPQAETLTQHLVIQYDNDENGIDFLSFPTPFVATASTFEEFTATIEEASHYRRAAIIPPAARLEYIKTWFKQASPYHFSFLEELIPFELYFGNDVTSFADWEMDSLRVSSERFDAGHINYWDFVNGNFTSDLVEAAQLFTNKQSSSEPRIQRMIDFLNIGQNWRQTHGYFKWYDLLNPFNKEGEEFERTFEQMAPTFWLAHNTSIIYWDKKARELGLWEKENVLEQQFINSVIIRVHFAADLPFTIPGYGNNIPPVGFVGISINHGPLSYPKQYPIPAPEHDVNFGTLSIASYLKFFFDTLFNRRTNSIYTWWIPTQADQQLYQLLKEKGISVDSPPEDWDREFIQPSQKTLEEIQHFYLTIA
ncbi:hypothetical protein AN963_18305 [Brevibacillus choshinensis]|uniref:Uncharacterized protein n=1 Tax=Brevibacillus choshinensis TaxID=54911 RepID=A0ABR5N886_BRECH|nr:hypothetical protein [Brevibacillus choshinensis]KQL46848.1 hypothetical protein AN963_18305 [Brevibacillus choshinensis]